MNNRLRRYSNLLKTHILHQFGILLHNFYIFRHPMLLFLELRTPFLWRRITTIIANNTIIITIIIINIITKFFISIHKLAISAIYLTFRLKRFHIIFFFLLFIFLVLFWVRFGVIWYTLLRIIHNTAYCKLYLIKICSSIYIYSIISITLMPILWTFRRPHTF